MQFTLKVRCTCGTQDTIVPKRTREEFEGKVYEDFTSITDGVSEKNKFSMNQYCEDVINVTCKGCGKTHELIT